MSETAEEKTTRRFVEKLDQQSWKYQITVFLTSADDIDNALELFQKARKHIARKLPNQTLLWRLCQKQGNPKRIFRSTYTGTATSIVAPYITIFITKPVTSDEFKSLLSGLNIAARLKLSKRNIDDEKVASYRASVKRQAPHNLAKVFGKAAFRRFGTLNQK